MTTNQQYIKDEKQDQLINFDEFPDYQEDIYDMVSGELKSPIPPEPSDLVRLHKLVRKRKSFTVLEFGSGYSTIVIADALSKNEADWQQYKDKIEVRNRFIFQLFSVDTSKDWIEHLQKKLPEHLSDRVTLQFSEVEAGTFSGQLCHYYKSIPNVIPDFIYLDGPWAKDVKGSVNGLKFDCLERTVMSADLLLMEPSFLPGTFIIIDGRTNNARFLKNNFKRQYITNWDKEEDVNTFELDEEPLGKPTSWGSIPYRSWGKN